MGEIFFDSKVILGLVRDLKEADEAFAVSEANICTFDSEAIGNIYAYEAFLNKFTEMSGGEVKFTDIKVIDSEYELDSSDVENFILQDLGINGKIKLKKFNFGAMNRPIRVEFKINGSSRTIEAESKSGWFDYNFLSGLNDILKELSCDKLFWASSCWEECSIAYATKCDVEKMNEQMKDNIEFRGNNPFSLD